MGKYYQVSAPLSRVCSFICSRSKALQFFDHTTALTLGAVPIAARIRTDVLVTTVIALGFVAAEDCRTALRDSLEHAALCRRGHCARAGEVGRPILLDNVSDFELGAGHGWSSEGEANGKVSRELGMLANAWGVTGRYRLVVRRLWWPNRSWRRRKSTPASSK